MHFNPSENANSYCSPLGNPNEYLVIFFLPLDGFTIKLFFWEYECPTRSVRRGYHWERSPKPE